MVAHGHADGAVGVHHLFGADHLHLVGVGVEAELCRAFGDFLVVFLDQREGPLGTGGYGFPGFRLVGSVDGVGHAAFLSNNWRKTG